MYMYEAKLVPVKVCGRGERGGGGVWVAGWGQEGWSKPKNFPWEGYGYFMEQHNTDISNIQYPLRDKLKFQILYILNAQ